jgi:hypothetical protein
MQNLIRNILLVMVAIGLAVLCCDPGAAAPTAAARQTEIAGSAHRLLPDGQQWKDGSIDEDTNSAFEEAASSSAAAGTCGSGYREVGKLCGEEESGVWCRPSEH